MERDKMERNNKKPNEPNCSIMSHHFLFQVIFLLFFMNVICLKMFCLMISYKDTCTTLTFMSCQRVTCIIHLIWSTDDSK